MALLAVIVVVWAVLFGGAYLCRALIGLSRPACLAIVTGCYLLLGAVALRLLGVDRAGYLGAFGMLLPYAAAVAVIRLVPDQGQPPP